MNRRRVLTSKDSRKAVFDRDIVMSSKTTIHFVNASTQQPMTLDLKGDWLDRSAEITLQGRPVGNISRSFMDFGQLVSDRQIVRRACCRYCDIY